MTGMLPLFCPCPKGVEELAAEELRELGAQGLKVYSAGLRFSGAPDLIPRVLLWARLPSRLVLRLSELEVGDADALYEAMRAMPWEDIVAQPEASFAFHATAAGRSEFRDPRFLALRAKDAYVDWMRDRYGRRPDVERERPELRFVLHARGTGMRARVDVGLDLGGQPLHRRGLRGDPGPAPLKENLAAALLRRAGWAEIAKGGGALVDPMCGSGTLLVEGAEMALGRAPGRNRDFGARAWGGFDRAAWQSARDEAFEAGQGAAALGELPPIFGWDRDPRALARAEEHAEAAGLLGAIRFHRRPVEDLDAVDAKAGLLITNPPYGERLRPEDLQGIYEALGSGLRQHYGGWRAAVLSSRPDLGRRLGLKAHKRPRFFNGGLECQLLLIEVSEQDPKSNAGTAGAGEVERPRSEEGKALFNRLRKRSAHLGKWAKREGLEAYRVYDRDLPEFALSVDRYGADLLVQEFEAPKEVDPQKARRRLNEALAICRELFELPRERVHLRRRRRQRGDSQYRALEGEGERFVVREGTARFWVDLHSYLDTGLFLDHRPTRQRLAKLAERRRFLNLFAYTASASVHAALGGARESVSVDRSANYCEWAQENFALNGLDSRRHRVVQDDTFPFLRGAALRGESWDLIFVDPPTFSNRKGKTESFEVQRDHAALLEACAAVLAPEGRIIFSCNMRRFRLDEGVLEGFEREERTLESIPPDFRGPPQAAPIHRVWEFSR